MTCHTCQQPIHTIVDHLYGRRSYVCGCGTKHRGEQPPEEPVGRQSNGFVSKGVFYGTCLNPACRREFESEYPRQSCLRDACLDWLKHGRHGKGANPTKERYNGYHKTTRTCTICKEPFEAWKADVCKKAECQRERKRRYEEPRVPQQTFCAVCEKPNPPSFCRPRKVCGDACFTIRKNQLALERYHNRRKAS